MIQHSMLLYFRAKAYFFIVVFICALYYISSRFTLPLLSGYFFIVVFICALYYISPRYILPLLSGWRWKPAQVEWRKPLDVLEGPWAFGQQVSRLASSNQQRPPWSAQVSFCVFVSIRSLPVLIIFHGWKGVFRDTNHLPLKRGSVHFLNISTVVHFISVILVITLFL